MTEEDKAGAGLPEAVEGSPRQLDLARIRRLIDELEAEISGASHDAPGVQDLHDELVTLRAVLDAPRRRSGWIAEGLHDIRTQLERTGKSMRGEAMREGVFITEIGRILGL